MKRTRILVAVVLSVVATVLAVAASKLFDRLAIDRDFGPLTSDVDAAPAV